MGLGPLEAGIMAIDAYYRQINRRDAANRYRHPSRPPPAIKRKFRLMALIDEIATKPAIDLILQTL